MYLETLKIEDLYRAYKKAKFELFNDKNSVDTMALFKYERKIKNNIEDLFNDINENGLKNISCSNYFEIPKSLDYKKAENEIKEDNIHFFSSSINHHKLSDEKFNNITLKFRKIINADINFHILSALWVEYIGQYLDEKFCHNIYGSRLVRVKPTDISSCEYDLTTQDYNVDSPRIFEPYQYKYQSWRNNSFNAIRDLHKSSSVIAITMDITGFYHNVIIDDFTTSEFYNDFGLNELFSKLPELELFHEDFIDLIKKWNESIGEENGLPIGLSASPILANAVMREFDKKIKSNLAPTYYGRYVDDILLVFPDTGEIKEGNDVLNYLISKDIVRSNNSEKLKYKNFVFKKQKQKIFYLDKDSDLSIIDAIEAEINSISSEWRFMPDLADENSVFLQKIVGFYADGNEFNDALRKIDATTIKKLGLSLLISHSHTLNQYIHQKEWRTKRYEIYNLIENHIFIPQNFFDNFSFISRIFRLMIHSEDGERAFCFIEKVFNLISSFKNISKDNIIDSDEKKVDFFKFSEYNYLTLQQVFIESYNISNAMSKKYSNKIIMKLFGSELYENISRDVISIYNEIKHEHIKNKNIKDDEIFNLENIHMPISEFDEDVIREINSHLFSRDLSFDGYATSCTEFILTKNKSVVFNKILSFLDDSIAYSEFDIDFTKLENYLPRISDFNKKIRNNASNIPLVFPTRQFSPMDISIVSCLSEVNDKELFLGYVNSLRGSHSIYADSTKKNKDSKNIIHVSNKKLKDSKVVNVAITNFKVEDKYWEQSVIQKPIKSLSRYIQLEQIVKEAVKKRPDYLVLPELSIPQEWAWRISQKLLANGISLISGVEYIHSIENENKIVRNPVMLFLVSDDIGFQYMKFFRQDKQIGAHGESIHLKDIANIDLKPDKAYEEKKIYAHGNFFFSCLICNELTDIENRMRIRGKVDALFIVEWNQDIKSFNALVESSSIDIHSYVVQVNNRQYGDSRIRAPYKEDFNRDVVQVKGGEHDYLIVGEINIDSLRKFQSHHISPKTPYKPVPTGFKMLESRKKWENDCAEDN